MRKMIYYEWLHFARNRARVVALLLFLLAAFFGLYNGHNHLNDRFEQIATIGTTINENQQKVNGWFDEGVDGPEGSPWVDINTPFWSMWYASHHIIDQPNPTMVFNIGQSEHFGYYKRVSMWSSAFDDDLTAEIANPELTEMGALDFSFVWLYLMPLLLIVLTFHTKGLEFDLGFLPLLKVQRPSLDVWLFGRLLIVGLGLFIILTLLIFCTILMSPHLAIDGEVLNLWAVYSLYLLIWLILAYVIISFGRGQADQALKMIGVWLLLAVAIPGIVNQYILIKKPADLMMSMIEAGRDGQQTIYDLSSEEIVSQAFDLMPELQETNAGKTDSLRAQPMINGTYRLVLNKYMSEVTNDILQDQKSRNQLIASTYWFNPVTGFHNWLNKLTNTDHEANLAFREEIRDAGKSINEILVRDEWNDRKMDKSSFAEYVNILNAGSP